MKPIEKQDLPGIAGGSGKDGDPTSDPLNPDSPFDPDLHPRIPHPFVSDPTGT